MERPRWATFDCYGTLVDWNAGIGAELGRLFGVADRHRLLERYHALEPRIQRGRPDASYRDVMDQPPRRGARSRPPPASCPIS